ncbi:MAG TPA: dihydrofolate reductase family protein [Ktedonobacterales bacterium]|jgi:dihydrofolate reductase
MRKVILNMRMTLDGFLCGPNGELDWMFRTPTPPDQEEQLTAFEREVDTTLLGRVAYLQQAQYWPSQTGELADMVNGHEKIVFSKTLKKLEWNNSRLATGDLAEEVARLKAAPGKNIYVSGGATLAQSLARAGLIDEYQVVIYPLALGAGRPLFQDLAGEAPLKLVRVTPYESGAVQLIYERG